MQRVRSLAAWALLGLFLAAVVVLTSTVASAVTPTTGRNYDPYNISQAADCSATNAPFKRICHETADDSAWFCELETGCLSNGTGWVQIGGGTASAVADGDKGDVVISSGVWAVDSNAVALGTDTTGGYAASATEGGAATTATALAANGANCSAGNYPLGVDASGAAESCTAITTGSPFLRGSWKVATTADDIYVKVPAAITLTALHCIAVGGTTPSAFVITVDECSDAGASCVASGGTVTLSALTTLTSDTTFTDAAIDAGDFIRLDITSLTTAPDYAFCSVYYTEP